MLLRNNNSIKSRFVLIFITVIIGFIVIGYVYKSIITTNAQSEQVKAEVLRVSRLVGDLELAVQHARQAEKNYLLDHDPSAIQEHRENVAQAYSLIDRLEAVLSSEDSPPGVIGENPETTAPAEGQGNRPVTELAEQDLGSSIRSMRTLINEYETAFSYVVEATTKRQTAIDAIHDKAGIIGEKILATNDLKLINSWLKMRGYEKDYTATRNYEFVTKLNFEMKDFALLLFDANISDDERNYLSKMMNDYNLGMLALTNGTTTVAGKIDSFNGIVQKLEPLMTKLKAREQAEFDASSEMVHDSLVKNNNIFLASIVLVSIVVLLFLFNTARFITRQINGIIDAIGELSGGNLTIRLFENREKDEISRLYNSLYKMKLRLAEVIRGIRLSAGKVSIASDQVAQGNQDLSQRSQEQASSLEEMASSMEQMTATVTSNADNAQQANNLAVSARQQAEQGGKVVGEVATAMAAINAASTRIADIISIIDGIAFQTNLLALNAAVEAARAGDQGRGFAVVAKEVRNLAGRCKDAASEIKGLVEDTLQKVESGTRLADSSGEALAEIVQSVKQVSDIVAEIAAASREQSEGISQVNKTLMQLDEVSQKNAGMMDQTAVVSETMQIQAVDLNKLVEYFRVEEDGKIKAAGLPGKTDRAVEPELIPAREREKTPDWNRLLGETYLN